MKFAISDVREVVTSAGSHCNRPVNLAQVIAIETCSYVDLPSNVDIPSIKFITVRSFADVIWSFETVEQRDDSYNNLIGIYLGASIVRSKIDRIVNQTRGSSEPWIRND